jgi:hypothetical protein
MGAVLAPIEPAFAEAASFIEATLDALLPKPSGPEARLMEAMRYAGLGRGKRLHAFLVLQSGRLFGVDRRALGRVAAAVECLHAYSRCCMTIWQPLTMAKSSAISCRYIKRSIGRPRYSPGMRC